MATIWAMLERDDVANLSIWMIVLVGAAIEVGLIGRVGRTSASGLTLTGEARGLTYPEWSSLRGRGSARHRETGDRLE
jgi:hypothetical protein